jgi:hypothetical protein
MAITYLWNRQTLLGYNIFIKPKAISPHGASYGGGNSRL